MRGVLLASVKSAIAECQGGRSVSVPPSCPTHAHTSASHTHTLNPTRFLYSWVCWEWSCNLANTTTTTTIRQRRAHTQCIIGCELSGLHSFSFFCVRQNILNLHKRRKSFNKHTRLIRRLLLTLSIRSDNTTLHI